MVKCPKCGNETNDNFCSKCGTKIEKQNICPNCNNELSGDELFCPKCGEKIKETGEESVDNVARDEVSDDEAAVKVSEDESVDNDVDSEVSDDVGSVKVSEDESVDDVVDDEVSDDVGSEKVSDEKTKKEDIKYCPYCNGEIEEKDEFCQECGKPLNINQESFESIKFIIQPKKIVIFSILSIIMSVFISLILSYIFSVMGISLYPIAFFISLIIILGIFASFKDYLNGGLVGIITGLFIGFIATTVVEYVNGFSFSYDMFSGYAPIIFTIFGAIMGVIASKFLRKHVKKYVDVETFF